MKWLWTTSLILASVVSAQAYTCADVRALSREQQAHYIKVFNITPAQQERIRQACYGQSWLRIFEQGAKWNFGLTAGMVLPANQERR